MRDMAATIVSRVRASVRARRAAAGDAVAAGTHGDAECAGIPKGKRSAFGGTAGPCGGLQKVKLDQQCGALRRTAGAPRELARTAVARRRTCTHTPRSARREASGVDSESGGRRELRRT